MNRTAESGAHQLQARAEASMARLMEAEAVLNAHMQRKEMCHEELLRASNDLNK